MPAVSVILPTCRRNDLLPRALKSLLNQTFSDFEIILVDDNPEDFRISKDGNLSKLIEEPRVLLIENNRRLNAARARNVGRNISNGKYVTYLDDDDAYLPNKLQRQWEVAEETYSPLVLCGLVYNLAWRSRRKQIHNSCFSGSELLLKACVQTSVLFHQNEGVPKFNEDLYAFQDAYFYFSLLEKFNLRKVPNVPEALVEIYPHSGERVSANTRTVWEGGRRTYFDFIKNYPTPDRKLFLARLLVTRYRKRLGCWTELVKNCLILLNIGGIGEVRFIINAFIAKIPVVRRFVIT